MLLYIHITMFLLKEALFNCKCAKDCKGGDDRSRCCLVRYAQQPATMRCSKPSNNEAAVDSVTLKSLV